MRATWMILGLLVAPTALVAQHDSTDVRPQIDLLLETPQVDSLLASLDERFTEQFLMLVPDLSSENRAALASAVESAFRPEIIRDDVASAMAADATPEMVEQVLEMRRAGSQAELTRVVEAYEPSMSLDELLSDVEAVDRERLQLMVSLIEARRLSDLELLLDEHLRREAHRLVNALGGDLGDFEAMPDDLFEVAYRNHTLRLALESQHALQPASEDLIRAVVAEHGTEPARWFADSYIASLLAAVQIASQQLAALTVPDAPAEAEPAETSSGLPCHAVACRLEVEWDGPEPFGASPAYGAPGDLERYLTIQLVNGGYSLVREPADDGFTIRVRPRATRVYCEVVTGTNSRTCMAVGRVRVEFFGSHPGMDSPPSSFVVQNRCRANGVMAARGIAALVAARIHHQLTTFPGDERRVPGC